MAVIAVTMNTDGVLVDVIRELNASKVKHAELPADPLRRAALILREAGEALEEALWLTRPGSPNSVAVRGRLYTEIAQTAAVAIRCMDAMSKEEAAK